MPRHRSRGRRGSGRGGSLGLRLLFGALPALFVRILVVRAFGFGPGGLLGDLLSLFPACGLIGLFRLLRRKGEQRLGVRDIPRENVGAARVGDFRSLRFLLDDFLLFLSRALRGRLLRRRLGLLCGLLRRVGLRRRRLLRGPALRARAGGLRGAGRVLRRGAARRLILVGHRGARIPLHLRKGGILQRAGLLAA
ncbi:protein of unknown function [Methylacidimicrobium sp. AP8]|nr:protein of unknown function [Methylacidimicrobium sp. AP8]